MCEIFRPKIKPKMLEISVLMADAKKKERETQRRFHLPLVHTLNLPDANLCEKRAEMVKQTDGTIRQACASCVTDGIRHDKRMLTVGRAFRFPSQEVEEIISFFASEHGTKFLTINGRGDPFHPSLKQRTLRKIEHAVRVACMRSAYVFTAGQNLDDQTCEILAEHGVNVMISLYGNKFIDASFFEGRQYLDSELPFQNQAEIARNIRRLLATYSSPSGMSVPLEDGLTRIGMNYVVSEDDLKNGGVKLRALKKAAEANGIFFICNTEFSLDPKSEKYGILKALARENSTFNHEHSTADERGQCMMGAGAAVTIDYDGTMLRCPYMPSGKGDGNFLEMSDTEREAVISRYLADTNDACALRRTELRG